MENWEEDVQISLRCGAIALDSSALGKSEGLAVRQRHRGTEAQRHMGMHVGMYLMYVCILTF